jgi:hypothetical protein
MMEKAGALKKMDIVTLDDKKTNMKKSVFQKMYDNGKKALKKTVSVTKFILKYQYRLHHSFVCLF